MILLRIWDREKEKFTKKLMYNFKGSCLMSSVKAKNPEILKKFNQVETAKRFSLDQYLGLRDIYKTKLFERDICIIRDRDKCKQYKVIAKRHLVKGVYFSVIDTKTKIYPNVLKNEYIELEIIGNVYQNKKLLIKEKKDDE
jgi:hypothetical protein